MSDGLKLLIVLAIWIMANILDSWLVEVLT